MNIITVVLVGIISLLFGFVIGFKMAIRTFKPFEKMANETILSYKALMDEMALDLSDMKIMHEEDEDE